MRDIEKHVCGKKAGSIRQTAIDQKHYQATGQLTFAMPGPEEDHTYTELRSQAETAVPTQLVAALKVKGSTRFGDLWPALLEENHLTHGDLKRIVVAMHKQMRIEIVGAAETPRTVTEDQRVALRG